MLMWILTGIFALISVVLLLGKGSFLIAGYNTAGREQKAKYDEKKLCRVMGAGMSVITLILLLCTIYGYELPSYLEWIIPWGIFGVVIFLVIATNTSLCKRKDYVPVQVTEADKKKETLTTRITIGILLFVFACVAVLLYSGDVKIRFDEDRMNIHSFLIGNKGIDYEDILSVEYSKDFEAGKRTGGIGSFKIQAGSFRNEEFGPYHLYSYAKCKEYVIMETTGTMLVVNGETPEDTQKLYEQILEKTEKN